MVLPDGQAKGLNTTLAKQGINMVQMKAEDMKTVPSNHDDFQNEKAAVHNYVESLRTRAYFSPQISLCIERVWGDSKHYGCAYTNFTLVKLRQILNHALESASTDLIRNSFEKPDTMRKQTEV